MHKYFLIIFQKKEKIILTGTFTTPLTTYFPKEFNNIWTQLFFLASTQQTRSAPPKLLKVYQIYIPISIIISKFVPSDKQLTACF